MMMDDCDERPDSAQRPSHVVGIGASAGGLEALELFFNAMPTENGMAFVVVQHLSPDFKSLMDELLSHRTDMAIHRVEDGMEVEANAIYLIPPRKEMIISGGRLLLTDKDPAQALTLPIDHFFRSLAQDVGRDAIAIVLSGTGSDGSRGLRDVHDAGGLVVVQSEETAKFDGMPKSAIDTGLADLVLPPDEIPVGLLRYVQHPVAVAMMGDGEKRAAGDNGMTRLFRLLRDEYGIDFSHYKPTTVGRRIERRLLMQQTCELDDYVDRLAADADELNSLYRDLLIGVTSFFRDAEAFRRLENDVLPGVLMQTPPNGEFRVWVPGCGTGEEAYSLAILIREVLAILNRPVDVKIFATDVHRASIDAASAGVFPEETLSKIHPGRLERYFTPTGSGFQVVQELRQMIVFAQHNIIKDAPFTKLDLVSCRNLLIYLQPNAQKKALSLFHFGLKTGGVLFLGPSESPAELADEFETLDLHWKVYRKRRDIRLPADLRLPLTTGSTHLHASALGTTATTGRVSDSGLHGAYDALLDEFMPPALLINERRELLHAFGGAERFLSLKGGRASTLISDLVDADLRLALSGALNRAEVEQQDVQSRGIRVDGCRPIRLSVKPIRNRSADTSHLLITLEEEAARVQPTSEVDDSPMIDIGQESRDRIESLENELRYTKENLQATVEELETSNEELQAANEELVASNEELQSTNEELHSVNEELYTVNAEYQRKINELTQLTNDMDNLLRSTEIGTIFLDCDLRIRKFTPQISHIFNLLPQDVGRRIDAFTHSIHEPQLVDAIGGVLESGSLFEREVKDDHDNWYLLRILPYRSSTAEIEGVVLTLINISAVKVAEAELRNLNRQLTGILDNSTTFLCVKDLEGRYTLCNHASEHVLGAGPERVCGMTDYEFLPTEVADVLQDHDRQVAAMGRAARFEEMIPDGDRERTYLSVKFPLRNENGRIYGVGSVCTDITDHKDAEEHQRQQVVRRDQFLAMLSHELRNPLGAIINAINAMEREADSSPVQSTSQVIGRQARHMSRLLDDLLDVSRVTQNKIELRTAVIDLRRTTEDAADAVRPLIERRGQQLSVDLPDAPIFVEADPARLQQLQVNLITNASRYNSDGGNVWVRLEARDNESVISVRDNGDGIPEKIQSRIFDLFIQSEAAHGRSDGGLGVGLTLVRSIVEKHGGKVEVSSDGPGTGSEFVVSLPLTARRPDRPQECGPHEASPEGTIIVVEDNPDARDTLCKLLELEGYQIVSARDGRSAIEVITEAQPDVALVDIGLPDIDGYQVARKLRGDAACHDTLLVALTGYGQSSDREAALAAGFDAHLVKPLDLEHLTRLIVEKRCRIEN